MKKHKHMFRSPDSAIHIILAAIVFLAFTSTSIAAKQESITKNSGFSGPIVVTLKPLYSLVAHLTEDIKTPVLLIKQIPSSHHYSIRPSQRRMLADAGIIVWFGPRVETYLSKAILQQENSPSKKTTVISAMQAVDLKLLNKRNKSSHDDGALPDNATTMDNPYLQTIDPHIWLSTHNAEAISRHIAQSLISIDPDSTEIYKKNLRQLLDKIEQTKKFIAATLGNSTTTYQQPFIVYHDAFQYFENENQLNYIDSISYNEETGPGLKHFRRIKDEILKLNIRCLVYQQPRPAAIDSLAAQTPIHATALDPLGTQLVSNDKDAWFELMRQLATGFEGCLNR